MAPAKGTARTGRNLRAETPDLNYMLATLGIEHDNDSDEDFVADEEEESNSSDTSDAEEREASTNQPGKMSRQPAKRTVRPTLKPQKSLQSTDDRLPPPVKKRKLMNLTSTSDGGECEDIMESDEAGGDVTSYSLVDSEYQPRKRKSKHLEEMDTMLEGTDEIENIVPPFNPTSSLESWASFEEHFAKYKKKYNLKFRVRSSVKTVHYNSTNEDQMPTEFEWTQRIFRCTHGVSQKSRSKGHRNRRTRYKKCKARLTAVVKRIAANEYEITIQNQHHTHSHPTTSAQAASYLTTKTLPLEDQDLEDVKTLADARVSSTHIANFLNDRIVGCKVTPQQTRNLLRSIMGADTGEDRLKDMLHALRQLDGSDVQVIQDQMDTTCGIIMQTKIQKVMFERWGETLAMDFTHNTNNLGYHLGSLVVTTASGRGFPVVDFVCLDEQATTISTVLKYFQEKNPRWQDIETVIIDKDFTEWRVLEQLFPKATILLCQFHAITYWKKVMKRPVYRLKVSQQEELLKLMAKLLYSSSKTAYEARYLLLKQYCQDNNRQAFFAYFEKNWNSCRGMWSNFARGKNFTAGNTTTNRIESNWNQLKMLLGLKTRIDKTVAGLLQHQIMITRQIVSEIGKHHSSSRMPKTVPRFLRAVAGRLSTKLLATVKKEWECFVNLMESAVAERSSETSSLWKVYSSKQKFLCHESDWTCTCLFYKSNRLPCRHLMHVARRGHGSDMLPASSIHNRWNMFAVLDIKEDLASEADALQSIVRMAQLKSPKLKLPNGNEEGIREPGFKGPKQVAYVRLRRNERADQVVLSSGEKYSYAKAMLEPLLQHLSDLSSSEFYTELNAWKEAVDDGLRRSGSKARSPATSDDKDEIEKANAEAIGEVDIFSVLDPTDAIETADLMNAMDEESPEDSTYDDSDNDSVAPTQPAEKELLQPLPLCHGVSVARDNSNHDVSASSAPTASIPVSTSISARQVDVINVPKPKGRGRPRPSPKRFQQSTITSRLAVHKYPSNLTVRVNELVVWARNTANLKTVVEIMDKYPIQLEDAYLRSRAIECRWEAMRPVTYMHPFVIPVDLTRSMEAAIKTARAEQKEPDALDHRIKKQGIVLDLVASIDPKLWKFSGAFVGALTTFYAVKAKTRSWFEDRKWLECNWRNVDSDVELFGMETGTSGISGAAVQDRHQKLANEVISKFTSSSLSSEFATSSGKGLISFSNIVGGLCRGWLNDSPVDFCLERIAEDVGHCFVLSTLAWSVGWPATPKDPITGKKFIVHPMNLNGNHWGVAIVRLHYDEATEKLNVRVYMYEPLIDKDYHEKMEMVWGGVMEKDKLVKEGLRGFLERWHKASAPKSTLVINSIEWVGKPQQPDFSSCGVMVVAQVYSYLTGNLQWQHCNVTQGSIKVMRLRMLWVIMCNSKERRASRSTTDKVRLIEQQLFDQLK